MVRTSLRLRHKYLFFGEAGELLHQHRWRMKIFLFVLVIGFLTALHVVVIRAGHMFEGGFHWDWGVLVALGAAVVLLAMLQWLAQRVSAQVIAVEPHPSQTARALVLFLSPPEREFGSTKYEKAYEDKELCGRGSEKFLQHFRESPWHMPLKTISEHMKTLSVGRLKYVVVIGSKDREGYMSELQAAYGKFGLSGNKPDAKAQVRQRDAVLARELLLMEGTIRSVGDFHQTVAQLAKCLGHGVEVVETKALSRGDVPVWQDGVDFEDADALVKVLQDAFLWLGGRGVRRRDVVVDITSGNKLCSAIGAAVSLDEQCRFQYVSTVNQELRVYDLEYVRPHEGSDGG